MWAIWGPEFSDSGATLLDHSTWFNPQLCDENAAPLVDIWHTTQIRAMVANGRYYDRAALDELLEAAHRAALAYRARGRP